MKGLCICIMSIAAIFFASSAAKADFMSFPRVKSMESRAAGGLFEGTAADSALLSPGWGLNIFRLEGGGTLSQALGVYGQVKDVVDFKDRWNQDFLNANYGALPQRAEELKNILRHMNHGVGVETCGEVLNFSYGNKKFGRMSLGGYWEGMAGLRLMAPDVNQIQVVPANTPFVSIGKETEVARGLGFGDAGGQVSYGRAFALPKGMEIAGGARLRVFHRWLVPAHTVTLAAELRGTDDIKVPADFRYLTGLGGALDLSTVLAVHDRFFDTKIAIGLRNAIAPVKYSDGQLIWDQPKPSLEVALKPFHTLQHDRLVVGLGVDEIEGDNATFGIGCYYALGNRWFHFAPRAGLVISRKDLLGGKSQFFTAGFSARFAIVYISGLYEQNFVGGFNAGAAFGLEI